MGRKSKQDIAIRGREISILTAKRLLENEEYRKDLEDFKQYQKAKEEKKLSKSKWSKYIYAEALHIIDGTLESEIKHKYNIARIYDIDLLKEVVSGKRELPGEMGKFVTYVNDGEIVRRENGCIYLKIKYDAPKELIIFGVGMWIDGFKKAAKQYNMHRGKRFRGEQLLAFEVWGERSQRLSFNVIAKKLNIKEQTAKKRYYRAYELITGKKFNPIDFQRPEVKKEYLKKECSTCSEHPDRGGTCKDLCPDVIALVEQDTKRSQRELAVGVPDKFSKQRKRKTNTDYYEGENLKWKPTLR